MHIVSKMKKRKIYWDAIDILEFYIIKEKQKIETINGWGESAIPSLVIPQKISREYMYIGLKLIYTLVISLEKITLIRLNP